MRLLQPKFAASPADEQGRATEIFRCAAQSGNDVPLVRVWTEPEIQWQLRRHDGVVACHRSGLKEGLISGYLMHAANAQKTKCLLIDDVLWGTLENEERLALTKKMLSQSVQAGAQIALLPCLGYADIAPFRAARFRSSPRTLHCYFETGIIDLRKKSSI